MDYDGGVYFRFTTGATGNYGNLCQYFTSNNTGAESFPYCSIAAMNGDWGSGPAGVLYMHLSAASPATAQTTMRLHVDALQATTEYEAFFTWKAMAHTDTTAPDYEDFTFGLLHGGWHMDHRCTWRCW